MRLKPRQLELIVAILLLLTALGIFLAVRASQSPPDGKSASAKNRAAPRAELIAATNTGVNNLIAVGERAKQINASLPFDRGLVEAAKPFLVHPDDANYPRALLCLRAAVYHESGFEPLSGRRAVAQVILNRLRHAAFPKSVCGVVYQGAASPVCQFSFACDQARHRPVAAVAWREAEQVAAAALAGSVEPSVGTSTHYHADYVAPRWAPLLTKVSKTGTHIFYRWPGSWGRRAAFSRRYLGEDASAIGQRMELDEATARAMQASDIRGIALLEVGQGKIAEEAVRGVQGAGTPVRVGDLWDVGANEGLIMATAIARLVERGQVSWDAPLRELFPDLTPYMGPELQAVTLVDLLSNPSISDGKRNLVFAANLAQGANQPTEQRANYFAAAIDAAIFKQKIYGGRDPGLIIAAAAVEGVVGRSYEDQVRREVFEPLGMRSAGFAPTSGPPAERPQEQVAGIPHSLSGPGRMQMSLSDFGKFLNDQKQGGTGKGKLLKVAGYRQLHRPHALASARGKYVLPGTSVRPFNNWPKENGSKDLWVTGVSSSLRHSDSLIVVNRHPSENRLKALGRALKLAR